MALQEGNSGGELVSSTFRNRIRETEKAEVLQSELESIARSIRTLDCMVTDDNERSMSSHTDQSRSLAEMKKKRDIVSAQLHRVLYGNGRSNYTH